VPTAATEESLSSDASSVKQSIERIRLRALDHGLLLLRVGAAGLIWSFHMMRKLGNFPQELREFPDPLGVGHAASFVMALASEGGCSILVAIGLATRLLSLPVVFTMLMVLVLGARGVEGADVQSALLYALPYTVLVLAGGGRWSIDHLLRDRYERLFARFVRRSSRHAGEQG
jgi:putative oxidoreductase